MANWDFHAPVAMQERTAAIPAAVARANPLLVIEFRFAETASPASLQGHGDRRELGLFVAGWSAVIPAGVHRIGDHGQAAVR